MISKNRITLQPDFYDCYFGKDKNIFIDLNEESNKENENELKLAALNKEINHVDNLIKNIGEKIPICQDKNNENGNTNNIINNKWKNVLIPYYELIKFIYNKEDNVGFIAAKTEGDIKTELAYINDPKNIMDQKKTDMNYVFKFMWFFK